jgi:hypothetical protein
MQFFQKLVRFIESIAGEEWRSFAILSTLISMIYTTRHICDLFNISHTTVKAWCTSYAPFLSDAAKPGKGKHAAFTLDDLLVFSFVVSHQKRGESHDDIFLSLKNGERGDLPDLLGSNALVPDSRQQIVLLENRIMQLQAEIERLKPFERQTIELNALLKKSEADLEKSRAEIRELYREIAKLEGRTDSE